MIDKKTVEQARDTDLIAYLEKRYGFTFAYKNGSYRCRQHTSLAVMGDRRSFFWHSKGIGGYGVLDYLIKVNNMPFRQAVEAVAGIEPASTQTPPTPLPARANSTRSAEPPTPTPKALVLPEKAGIPLKLYDYLCVKRGIDGDIVNSLIQKGLIYEDKRGNVVFVGHDELGAARFACVRGTRGGYRGDCAGSDKRYGFHTVAREYSDQLYIYESAIDLMSHASMENAFKGDAGAWERRNRLSLAGTTDAAIPYFLNQHKEVRELVFCLDNDPAGRDAASRLSRKYADKGYYVRIEPPYNKDFNEDLLKFIDKLRLDKSHKIAVKMHNNLTI